MKIQHLISTLLLCVSAFLLHGQNMEDARGWYLEGRYAEALPVFLQEYLNDPDNAALNQWVGVSLLKTGRFMEAEKYLAFASQKKIPESFIYLGELYARMYRFEAAEEEFGKYQRANRRNEEALEKLTVKREEAERLRRATNRTEDIQIIDSLVLPKSAFLAAYKLSLSSGSLMPVNEFFRNVTTSDKTLFMNERQDKIYYSQGNSDSGFDLFTMDKLLDSYGNEKKLPESVNMDGDQAYPFVLSDGMTLYFASTGHQSLGGYDLYVTRYNLATDSYLTPNQLNMPFNSPFNDYMMAIDDEKGVGWFASDRYQHADSVCIYTFLPNAQVTLIESDDPEYLSRRARIASIAETWKIDSDYTSHRAVAQQQNISQQTSTGDFLFVINDRATYHHLSDFKNNRARSLFSQALGLESQLRELNKELSGKRDQYTGGSAANNTVASEILTLEKETEMLFREIERLKLEARNEETENLFN
ncbi:MAG: tetratricopeptide repeat protein [Bacteroidales bacterium]|nr:tetratricopeptide repeat protein [Bacteroidales bacterium]